MEDFRRQFLVETAEKLENLLQTLRGGANFSNENKRETLRILHTVKGTAQTFGYASTSRLAHDLETLFEIDGNNQNLIVEGIEFLQKSLAEDKFQISEQFSEKLQAVVPKKSAADDSNNHLPPIPDEFFSQLSSREKEFVHSAVRRGKNLAVVEAVFELANFADGLVNFREVLSSTGEIVATFPGTRFAAHGKIGFQFLTVGLENAQTFAAESSVHVIWENSTAVLANNLEAVLSEIVKHGEKIAEELDKKIEIEVESDEIKLSFAELQIVFESLLHLVRNAVDHAIERAGTIKINVKKESNDLRISVVDDGNGIDLERVKAKAIEKKFISGDENLDEKETLELIFQPELSTKTETTEISGRGIGLDTVKNSIEKSGGKISVKTEKGKGTTFEIVLPHQS